MEGTIYKHYKSFKEFYKEAFSIVTNFSLKTKDLSSVEKITYIRTVFDSSILKSYYSVCNLPNDVKQVLTTNVCELKFSMDNMVKNIIAHPEVLEADYYKISSIVNNPSKFYKSKNGYDVILFKAEEKFYKLVIKTTKNKKENFIKSLHLLNKERFYKY